MAIGIGIAIAIFNEDRDRDRDLNFGDRAHALFARQCRYACLLLLSLYMKIILISIFLKEDWKSKYSLW